MSEKNNSDAIETLATTDTARSTNPHRELRIKTIQEEAAEDVVPLKLGWRTWLVVFTAAFTVMTQIFTTIAASTVISFISRDLGGSHLTAWIIHGPLLMQAALSPIFGRLSDILDRKYLVALPPLVAFAGSIMCAKASNVDMIVVGSILIGVAISTIAIVHAIPSEILPLKYRALSNGIAFIGGVIAGIVGSLSAGAFAHKSHDGWRNIFWTQAAFHLACSFGFLAFYWPKQRSDFPKMKFSEYIWACDPIGSFSFITSATLILLALNWAGGNYSWSDAHVIAPLTIGCVFLVFFCLYEWKGRSDGLIAHVFFQSGPNFMLSVFAFSVEGWIFYSAVNAITPQMILRLGWETDAWRISVRQLSFQIPIFTASLPIIWYATKYKDLKNPLVICYTFFLITTLCYSAAIRPSWSTVQMGINVLAGIGQAGPLTLLIALTQFTAPHAYLSTATGLSLSSRALGGAFGSAVLDAIISGYVSSHYEKAVTAAMTNPELLPLLAGSEGSSNNSGDSNTKDVIIRQLLALMENGEGKTTRAELHAAIPALSDAALTAAVETGHWVYAKAYRLAWSSIVPFTSLSLAAVLFLRDVRELMTEKVEESVEKEQTTIETEGGQADNSLSSLSSHV